MAELTLSGMALPFGIDRRRRLVTVTLAAPGRADEAIELLELVSADPRYEPGFAFLLDRRTVRTPPFRETIAAMVDYLRRHPSVFAGSRWAIVVSGDVPTAAALLAASDALSNTVPGVEVRSFLVLEDALRWLAADRPQRD